MALRRITIALLVCVLAQVAFAQRNVPPPRVVSPPAMNNNRVNNNAYGTGNGYYYSSGYPTYIPPVVQAPVQRQIVLGPVRAYTDEEYARLVLSTLSVPTVQPATLKTNTRSLVVSEESAGVGRDYKRARTKIVDILDRGIMIADTREELRLRGVRMLSERDNDQVYRYYAREGIRTLREATAVGSVYVDFEDPVRDGDGTLLGIVYLDDGTELNRLILSQGLGQLEPKDFQDDRDIADLVEAEQAARQAKIGIWSH